MDRFVKRGTRAAIASEARSLEWLADAAGAATVPLLEVTPTWLATERLRTRNIFLITGYSLYVRLAISVRSFSSLPGAGSLLYLS